MHRTRSLSRLIRRRTTPRVCVSRTVNALAAEPFMSGTNSSYIEDMYRAWTQDPNSVHKSWASYFASVNAGASPGQAFVSPAALTQGTAVSLPTAAVSADTKTVRDHLSVQLIIKNYQMRGHNIADLDPLGINSADLDDTVPPELELGTYGLTELDYDREFMLPSSTHIGGDKDVMTLREIVSRLKGIYCDKIGVEYLHINNMEQQNWIREQFEKPQAGVLTHDEKKTLFKRLIRSTKFEDFLSKKWPAEKRFGVEGCEVLIPAIKQILDTCSTDGVKRFVVGMPHRGRLNVLANVCRQPLDSIFSQFSTLEAADEGSGDVKYHLGVNITRLNRQSQKEIEVSVVANPSHLEAVNPVVQGKARAHQYYSGDTNGDETMSILMHGDAAFSGQGVVYETFHLSDLPSFTTHGTIHIVVNNQVGFTTDPRFSRSSPYCTDVARVVGAPIFHVNSDHPELVMHVCKVAAAWRQKFKKDVVLDLVCYRKHGHNELDEPMFTQPRMYSTIKKTKPVLEQYQTKIVSEGAVDEIYVKEMLANYGKVLEDAYNAAQKITMQHNRDWLDSPWDSYFKKDDPLYLPDTGISRESIEHIGKVFSSVPEDFHIHNGLKRVLKARADMIASNQADWAIGEAMAFGALLGDGIHVRLTGQDVERGTFSHRHHVLHDQKVDMKVYKPLDNLWPQQAGYSVCNSSLSEYAVLGFELGYSMTNPRSLVLWEGQFGDFSNTAQCIIDQFICSGTDKWTRQSAMVMLLPHGLEGMGPEHSSARPERFLQMCKDEETKIEPESPTFEAQQLYDGNWIIANCTTPANIFHILRRQVLMHFKRPLVLMTPKSLLRHPEARSSLDDFGEETRFQRLIPESRPAYNRPDQVNRVVFCTGKIYYELARNRRELGLEESVAIARVEQISPFPFDLVAHECARYPQAELIWTQEEHKNMGAWTYIQPRINSLLNLHAHHGYDVQERPIKYVGRAPAASPATGNKFDHIQQQKKVLADSLNVSSDKVHL